MRISDWSSDVCSSDLHSGGTRCLVTLVDRTAEVRTEQHLRREMLTDSLTGLPNRAGFSDRLESMIEAGRVASCAVLVVDLDRFSRVNACLGELAGDELLLHVARRIKGTMRVRGTMARSGGDTSGRYEERSVREER